MVTLALEELVVEHTVFFPVFTRYFLARGRSFKIMIADLLKHSEASQNKRPPLILRADVPRLKHIAHKRMGYLRDTCCFFKDTVYETNRDNIALIKWHMKMCIKHYHALMPQLDLIATQWGVDIEDTLSHDDLGTPQKLASNKKVEAASARKTRAKTAASRGDLSRRIDGGRQNCGGGESESVRTGPLPRLWRPGRGQSSDRSDERHSNSSLTL
jgi:hypothetical protein